MNAGAEHIAGNGRQTDPPAVELRGVHSGYERTTILREINLEVPAHKVVALLGPNGAGKTTLLKTISGLITPSQGSVRLNGVDVTRLRPSRRVSHGLCHIPEGRGIYRSLTVRENLFLQADRGKERAGVERAIEAFPALRDRLGHTAGSLSGGQQQMLSMARAYVQSPSMILVDEASLGLAPIVVGEMFDSLHHLAETGAALLMVDQFAAQTLKMADVAYVLRRGEVVFRGDSQTLLEKDVFEHYLGTEGVEKTDDPSQTESAVDVGVPRAVKVVQ